MRLYKKELKKYMKLLTIALCTYNRSVFLPDAIKGILAQTYKGFELIIYDNASTDDTEEVVKSFSDDRIKYLKFDQNVGMAGNWLRAIRDCKTKYLSIAHDDDIMEPTLIEREIDIFEKDPEMLLVTCKSQYVTQTNSILEGKCNSTFTEDKSFDKYEYFELMYEYTGANFLSAPAAMFRTSCLGEIDYDFFKWTGSTADIYWYLRINELGKIYLMHDALLRYRLHDGQYSDNRLDQIKEHRDHILPILAEYLEADKVEMIRTVYQNEIDALEFIKTITAKIDAEHDGYYLPDGSFVDKDLFSRIKYINHLARGERRKYVIWGASIAGYKNKKIFEIMLPNYELVGFIDRSKTGEFEALPIYSPDSYDYKSGRYIVVCTSTGAYSIKAFLEEKGLEFMQDFIVGNILR